MTPIDAIPDHVAVAVPDYRPALERWRAQLGGATVSRFNNAPVFRGTQLRYANRGKLELLQPSEQDPSPDNFVRRFLARYGSQVHHVTLKVADLPGALDRLTDAGFEPVDVELSGEDWKESFLRPSQIGGLVVQVAWSSASDDEWAARVGFAVEPVKEDSAQLLGPLLRHPDLTEAERVWSALGATVTGHDNGILARWDGAPLEVMVVEGDVAGPVGLRFRDAPQLAPDERLGPGVLAVS